MDAVQEAHARALKGLHLIDDFCRANGIEYVLMAGTVLGAVRHQGFIPWDDDVDIGMTVPNYDKFCALFQKELPEGYFWSTPRTNLLHPRFYGKLIYRGQQCVDVFPIVKTAKGYLPRRLHWLSHKLCYYSLQRKLGRAPVVESKLRGLLISLLCCVYAAIHTREFLIKKAEALFHKYEGRDFGGYLNYCSRYSMEREAIDPSWPERTKQLPFEDGTFPVFQEADAYLSHLYGDYMTPPAAAEQVAAHSDFFFEIQTPEEEARKQA